MPAQRKVGRHAAGESAHEPAIDVAGGLILGGMRQRMPLSLLKINPERDGSSGGQMHEKLTVVALPRDDDRRQDPPPGTVGDAVPRGGAAGLRGRIDMQRGEHAGERVTGDESVLPLLRVILVGDAKGLGQLGDFG